MNGFLKESNFLMVEEGFTTRDLLESLLEELCQESHQQAFFVADLGDIVKKHLCFLKALPRVKPYFPVKCNGSEGVIRLLAELGAGFACANKAEITLVQGIGVPADRIFYSSPCKQVAHIRYAATHGVRLMAFDNEVELSKVARSHPRARMLLGITADSIPSAHPSMAFGTTLKSCRHLLETAKEQAVEVVGISFHLGSRGLEPQALAQAVAAAQLVFDMGTELGHPMHLLDIGGGFPGTEDTRAPLEEIAAGINSALDLYFPEGSGVDIVARPGRYYVTSAFTLAVSITALEEIPTEQPGSDEEECGSKKSLVYHLSDGIYGAFSCLLFDSPCPRPGLHKLLEGNFALFCTYTLGFRNEFQNILLAIMLSATLTIPFWQWFLTRFGKKTAVYVGISSAIPFLIAVVLLDSNIFVTYVVAVAAGISVAAAFLLPWSMLPDVIDDFKLQHPSSHGHEAIFFSFYVFFTKFTAGVSLGISTLSLDFAGYQTRGCSQPGQVNFTLKMLVSAVPVGLILLSLLLFKLYPIDEEKRRKNKKALQDLREESNSSSESDNTELASIV